MSLIIAAILLALQGFVISPWQLIVLRFATGLALGGTLPCISSIIRHSLPAHSTGKMLGYSVSAQYIGQVTGPLLGGYVATTINMSAVFLMTSLLMLMAAYWVWQLHAQKIKFNYICY